LPAVIAKLLPDICKLDPSICLFDLDLLMGPSNNLNVTRMSYYMKYEPNPTSTKNMAHWAQGVRTGTFQMFDYGPAGNQQHYNQATPPQYKLSNLPSTLPLALFCGTEDYLGMTIESLTL
jgi:lysosomal acid lipase/cholesteryl ester hydrolase